MKRNSGNAAKKPGLLGIILETIRSEWQRNQQIKRMIKARAHLERGDPVPMQHLASESIGEAWLSLADYYADQRPEDAALATEAYRNAIHCKDGFQQPPRLAEEYDRRRFLGIGATPDLQALAKEWKSWHSPGYERETQLAWIFAYGPAELRNRTEAWWWVAVAEACWGQCRDVELPSHSAAEIREYLVHSLPKKVRDRIQTEAKEHAYRECISGK